MKKTKIDNNPKNHLLASKRASLQQDKLNLSYKSDWDPTIIQNVDSKSNSNKAFFQNMKEELSTIKHDFEKLLKKESSFTSANKPSTQENSNLPYQTIGGIIKGKSMSSYKKDDKKIFFQNYDQPKRYEMMPQKESVNQIISNKLFSAQKNTPFNQKKPIYSQALQLKEKDYFSNNVSVKASTNKSSDHSQPLTQQSYKLALAGNRDNKTPIQKQTFDKVEKNNIQRDKQNIRLKQLVRKQNEELAIYKKDRQALRTEYQKASTQKQLYMSKLTEMSKELSVKMNYAAQQELKIKDLSQELKKKETELIHASEQSQEIDKQRAFYGETINQLRFHNQNFHKINWQLGQENQVLKQNLQNVQHLIEHSKEVAENIENDLKRKLEFSKKEIQQYEKREVMFTKQIERLSEMLSQSGNTENFSREKQIVYVNNSDTQVLYQKIEELNKQLELQKQINVTLTEKYEENVKRMNIFQLKATFQQKINFYIQENTKLKSMINHLQAENQSSTERNHSYLKEIEFYEQRERNIKTNKKLSSTQWEEMTEQIQKLKQQNKILVQKLQTKQLKEQNHRLQNSIQMQTWAQQNILKLAHTQLQEIQELKSKINELQRKNESLTRENLIYNQKNPQNIQSQIISALKQLIFKILLQKIGKEQYQGDNQFFLKRVQQIKSWLLKDEVI